MSLRRVEGRLLTGGQVEKLNALEDAGRKSTASALLRRDEVRRREELHPQLSDEDYARLSAQVAGGPEAMGEDDGPRVLPGVVELGAHGGYERLDQGDGLEAELAETSLVQLACDPEAREQLNARLVPYWNALDAAERKAFGTVDAYRCYLIAALNGKVGIFLPENLAEEGR